MSYHRIKHICWLTRSGGGEGCSRSQSLRRRGTELCARLDIRRHGDPPREVVQEVSRRAVVGVVPCDHFTPGSVTLPVEVLNVKLRNIDVLQYSHIHNHVILQFHTFLLVKIDHQARPARFAEFMRTCLRPKSVGSQVLKAGLEFDVLA